jgi:two-component system, OmpR family, KDP operon response regulator KdpE
MTQMQQMTQKVPATLSRLLVVEDDPTTARVVAFGARMAWPNCAVTLAENGREALDVFEAVAPQLVVLDVSMPPPDGFEVCQRIREVSMVPILMLTARCDTMDKVRALELGADDYLTKPFDHLELLARLKALVRRASAASAPEAPERPIFVARDFSLDFTLHEVRLRGALVPLTSTEYRLLEVLVHNAGMTMTHRALLDLVWGDEYLDATHFLKVFIRRLRRKLGDDVEQPRYIVTERGLGYRFLAYP